MGDGWICKNKKHLRFGIMGTIEIINWIVQSLSQICPVNHKIVKRPSPNSYTINISGITAYKILSILYRLETPNLSRKWDNFVFLENKYAQLLEKSLTKVNKQI
jgi:hypothetical protein